MRELFRVADDLSPSIVFVDEIDAVGTKRYDASHSDDIDFDEQMMQHLYAAASRTRCVRKPDGDKKDKKFEPAAPPARVGCEQRRQKGSESASCLPTVTPLSKCKLRLLKLERIKDYLLMEEEVVANQEWLKPQEEKAEEDRFKVDDLRGSPMSVGNLEELIDENHAVVSSSVGPEYYIMLFSFVGKDQLEHGCSIWMHNEVLSIVGFLQNEVDLMVSVMKVETAVVGITTQLHMHHKPINLELQPLHQHKNRTHTDMVLISS